MFVRELKFRAAVLLLLTVLAYSAVSCGVIGGSNDDLAGTKWKIETMGGAPPPVTLIITAEFNDGRVSGSSGCNSYGATYTIDNGKLEIGDIVVTEMACMEEGVMQFEQSFLELLGMVRSYSLNESRLDLLDEAGNAVLSFVAAQ